MNTILLSYEDIKIEKQQVSEGNQTFPPAFRYLVINYVKQTVETYEDLESAVLDFAREVGLESV